MRRARTTLCALVLATTPVLADQGISLFHYQGSGDAACTKKWYRFIRRLSPEEQAWERTNALGEKTGLDFTGDGVPDVLRLESQPWRRGCEPEKDWYQKNNTVVLTDGSTGKSTLYNWKGGLLRGYKLDTGTGALRITEFGPDGVAHEHKIR